MNEDIIPIIIIITFCIGLTSIAASTMLTPEKKKERSNNSYFIDGIIDLFETFDQLYLSKKQFKDRTLARFLFVFGMISSIGIALLITILINFF